LSRSLTGRTASRVRDREAIESMQRFGHQSWSLEIRMPARKPSRILAPMKLSDVYLAPGHLIRRSQQIAVAIFFEEFDGLDVTPVQYAALIAIRERPGMDQRTLVDQIAIDRSTIGSMLKTLESRGLIVRTTPKNNQRVKQLFITEAGDRLLQSTREQIYRVQERILAPLNPKERKLFTELLSRLVHINNRLSRAPLKIVSPSRSNKKQVSRTSAARLSALGRS
jgi:MarR family transcriptional regulator, lower aerobic nicotinate degradation pathway regulator